MALAQARLFEVGAGRPELRIDGLFGPETETAVLDFQSKVGVATTGKVDPPTWLAMDIGRAISAVDVIDATDITVYEEDHPHLADGHSQIYVNYGMSRGVRHLIDRLVACHRPRSVALLRLHGHGSAGHMVVSGGTQGYGSATIAGEHFANPEARAAYQRLGSIMKPYGSIELHGCNVATRANGQRLLAGLVETCGVPVTAALRSQLGGAAAARFEGATASHFPGRSTLPLWARSVFTECEW
ncbi:MAG TPA: peptidoglycan-binding domain-containing protein [Polyangiales bacterium]